MKKIPLSQGLFALVSDEDYERVSQFKWAAHNDIVGGRRKWFAGRTEQDGAKRRKIKLSRFIFELTTSDTRWVDHLDGDTLDCRRENMELVYQSEKMRRARNWKNGYKKIKQDSARKGDHKDSKREQPATACENSEPSLQQNFFLETDS